jgi:hypothetical protein
MTEERKITLGPGAKDEAMVAREAQAEAKNAPAPVVVQEEKK